MRTCAKVILKKTYVLFRKERQRLRDKVSLEGGVLTCLPDCVQNNKPVWAAAQNQHRDARAEYRSNLEASVPALPPLHPGVTRNVGSTPRGGASWEHSKGLQTSLTRNNDAAVLQAATAVVKIMPEPRPALRSIIDFMFCVFVTGGCYRGRKQSGCSLRRPSLKKNPLGCNRVSTIINTQGKTVVGNSKEEHLLSG